MTIISELGLPTAEISINDFDAQRALVITRFDRQWTKDNRLLRVPQEDCCQALSFPHTLKYQSDGGPGILSILEFLKASNDPQYDQKLFLKAQIVFWLLGVTDGHAKIFSVFLYPGGGFQLTPLYDVMSTQPLLDAGQIRRNQMRMAMSVGSNRHTRVHDVLPRHFQQSAASAGVPAKVIKSIFMELAEQVPAVLDNVRETLPQDFPVAISKSIIGGTEQRMRRIRVAIA
jgi:serine/threonine-protein kinase HipA